MKIENYCRYAALLSCVSLPTLVRAQEYTPPGLAPVRETIDENGVDLSRGVLVASVHSVSIGDANDPGMVFARSVVSDGSFRDSSSGTLTVSGSTITVNLSGATETFTQSGSTYLSDQKTGSTLTLSSGGYTYTLSNGTTALLNTVAARTMYGFNASVIRTLTRPNGEQYIYNYRNVSVCARYIGGNCVAHVNVARLQAITSNRGYMLRLGFVNDDTDPENLNDTEQWMTIEKATLINTTVDYCDPSALSCTFSQTWPSLTMDGTNSFTDAMGRTTAYTFASTRLVAVKRPGAASVNVSIAYDGSGMVSSVLRNGVTTSYAYSDVSGVRTTTVNASGDEKRIVKFDLATMQRSSDEDALGRKTTFTYDPTSHLPKLITAPELNATEYAYDARGNVTTIRAKPKPGSAIADLVQQLTYPPSDVTFPERCAAGITPVVCNKPLTVADRRNNITDYTYDAGHGGVLTVTRPAPTSGATRPQTRYSYGPLYAWYKTGSGSQVQAATPIQRLLSVSQCITGTSCAGSASEVQNVANYQVGSASVGSNLLPVTVTARAGDGSVASANTLTYDATGNVTALDGPLTGTADTTYARYDLDRETVGIIAPDPDGAGVRKRQARRLSYNADGQVMLAELGTVAGVTDPDWAAFVSYQQSASSYDVNARPVKAVLTGGGTTYSVAEYSYDSRGRPDCTALRMNSATWSSPVVPTCTLGTTGTAGPDRISQTIYDVVGRPIKTRSAVGTTDPVDDATGTYTVNGKLATLSDGQLNLTTYEYDRFDRVLKTRYPVVAVGSNTSSTTDYEQLGYDSDSNVTSRQLRDGSSINFTYDALSRPTYKDLPSGENDTTYAYDLLGRLTGAVKGSLNHSFSYDPLGRLTQEAQPFGSMSFQYDPAGRRTRRTWNDGFYATYDYDVTGKTLAIRENGAGSGVGVLATYDYDDQGRRKSLTRGNGTVTTYGFDATSRLSSLTQNLSGTSADLTLGFGYNPASQITATTRSNDAYAWTGATNINQANTVNGLNQLTTSGSVALGYDAKGNLTTFGGTTYAYSAENMLTSVNAGTTLSYDALGRLAQYDTTVSTRFLYDGAQMAAEYLGGSVTVARRYVFGPGDDEPVIWYEGSGTGDRRWLHADERGSIIAVSNVTGATSATNSYDEYGIPAATNSGRFQYTGQAFLPEIGLFYYKARMYSAPLGRFLQTDPIGYENGINWYNYVGGDPINFKDPTGKATVTGLSCPGGVATPSRDGSADDNWAYVCVPNGRGGGGSYLGFFDWTSSGFGGGRAPSADPYAYFSPLLLGGGSNVEARAPQTKDKSITHCSAVAVWAHKGQIAIDALSAVPVGRVAALAGKTLSATATGAVAATQWHLSFGSGVYSLAHGDAVGAAAGAAGYGAVIADIAKEGSSFIPVVGALVGAFSVYNDIYGSEEYANCRNGE